MFLCARQLLVLAIFSCLSWSIIAFTILAKSESESYLGFKDGADVSVAAVAGSSLSSDEVCPFTRPCVCFAGRITCAPKGPVGLQPLNAVSSDTASKVTWYGLRIEGLESIDHLPSATTLSVKNLHITRSRLFFVPIGILSELTGVLQLNLSRNRISRLRGADFEGVPLLQQLDLSQNLLRIIDKNAFTPLPDLRQLNLALNSLLSVPEAVRSLRKLTHLDLYGNPIKVISDYDFNHLGRLLQLDLSNMNRGLVIQKRAFCGLRSVRRMSNQIKLETGLNALKMRDNNISEWDPCSLYHLRHLIRSVDFRRTTLSQCTCHAASLKDYFRVALSGTDLIKCVRRRQDDPVCANISCVSYCASSGGEFLSPLSICALSFPLIFSFIKSVS